MPTIRPDWEYASLVLPVDGTMVKVSKSRPDLGWINVSMQGLFTLRLRPESAAALCRGLQEVVEVTPAR